MSTNQVQFCSAIVRAHFGPVVEVRGGAERRFEQQKNKIAASAFRFSVPLRARVSAWRHHSDSQFTLFLTASRIGFDSVLEFSIYL